MTQVPPHDPFQEAVLLTAAIVNGNTALADILSAGVVEADFFNAAHRILWRGIIALDEQSKPYDVVSLYGWIRQQGLSDRVPSSFVGDMLKDVPAKATLAHSAKVVRKLGALREAIDHMHSALADGYAPPRDMRSYFDGLLGQLDDIVLRAYPDTQSSAISVLTQQTVNELHNPPTTVATTHIAALDKLLGPLHRGYNLVLAARPGMGKTALALHAALYEAMSAHGVIIATLEQPAQEIVKRLMYNHGGINGSLFRTGKPTKADWNDIHEAAQEIQALPIRIIDDVSDPMRWRMRVLKEARSLEKEGYPVTLVVTDYLQLMQGRGNNREEVISDCSRRTKAIAKELGCAHVTVSQLNREVERREDKHPVLSDLRESGSLEQDADSVVFVYRDGYYKGSMDPLTELGVAKNRHGSVGTARCHLDLPSGRFEDIPV